MLVQKIVICFPVLTKWSMPLVALLFFSFMDSNSSYHKELMSKKDKRKITLITSRGVCNYKIMPFGLTNAGPTIQRLKDKVFKK